MLATALLVSSCSMTVKIGAHPQAGNLNSLKLGESTKADVVLALGEPRGSGVARFAVDNKIRHIWFYEYIESDGTKAHFEILLVFMQDNKYDGHLWFSSFSKYKKQGGDFFTPSNEATGGFFPATDPLEVNFKRDDTTEEEVISKLGTPTGTGKALIPPGHRAMDVLEYEKIGVKLRNKVEKQDNIQYMGMDMNMNVGIVLIHEGKFEGFMWFTSESVKGQLR